MRKVRALALVVMLAAVLCPKGRAQVFSLNPVGGALSGTPGSTVGWGFTIDNASDYYLKVTKASFCSDSSYCGSAPTGFRDFISQTYLNPRDILSEPFDVAASRGLGSYTFPSGAAGTWGETMWITYDRYSGGFEAGNVISFGNTIGVHASVTAVPFEPSSAIMFLFAGGTIVLRSVRGRRARP